jgi:two-component system alkaline phosphatase synthesis response regulator PhoP
MKRQLKVLIIDDDIDFVNATKTVLESQNYQISVAYNGGEGLQKARGEKPDLIILDIIMPIKDGFTVAEQIKKDSELSRIPVLILTSFSSRKGETSIAVSEGMKLQTEDYIEKPAAPEELLKAAERLLKKIS